MSDDGGGGAYLPFSPSSPSRSEGLGGGATPERGDSSGVFDTNNFAVVIRGACAARTARGRFCWRPRCRRRVLHHCPYSPRLLTPVLPVRAVRPPLPREQPFVPAVLVRDERSITISENLAALDDVGGATAYSTHTLNFDYVYDENSTQRTVYETTAKGVVESSLKGYNATIFAYGQTGTGKTYTMEGFNSAEERGIIPRAIEQIFRHIQTSVSPRMRFLVRASYLQIYNEVISDLLKPQRTNLWVVEAMIARACSIAATPSHSAFFLLPCLAPLPPPSPPSTLFAGSSERIRRRAFSSRVFQSGWCGRQPRFMV